MADALTIIGLLVSGGAITWVGTFSVEWLKQRGTSGQKAVDNQLDLEKHRDNLTFQLLEAARTEISALRVELTRLRPMEGHLIHFEEALLHIEALLTAAEGEAREIAERNARLFLGRMRTPPPPAEGGTDKRVTKRRS